MTTEQQQAFMLFLSDELLKGMWVPNMQQNEAALRARTAHELRRLHALFQALIAENETLHAENKTLRAGYDAARLEIESLQKATTDRHALQAAGAHPAPCARYCEAQAFFITMRNLHAEIERLRTCNKDAQHEIANLQESMSKTATDLLRESYDDVIQGTIPDPDDPWDGYPWFENTRTALATPTQKGSND